MGKKKKIKKSKESKLDSEPILLQQPPYIVEKGDVERIFPTPSPVPLTSAGAGEMCDWPYNGR